MLVLFLWLQYYPIIQIAIKTCKSGGIDAKIHGLSIIGRVNMNEEEAAASFSFLSVEEADGMDGGLIRRQRRMAEGGAHDGNACKVFVWGLNDRHQLGSSQSETKVRI